jgi:hypothetical protein
MKVAKHLYRQVVRFLLYRCETWSVILKEETPSGGVRGYGAEGNAWIEERITNRQLDTII